MDFVTNKLVTSEKVTEKLILWNLAFVQQQHAARQNMQNPHDIGCSAV